MWKHWNSHILLAGLRNGSVAMKNSSVVSHKLTIQLVCDPAILLLGKYSKELKNRHSNTCTHMCIAALLTTAQSCKSSKCSPTSEWITNEVYKYDGILFSHKQE